MSINIATQNDIENLAELINSGYRGEFSKNGWTTEANLISGEKRTDANDLLEIMQTKGSVFLKFENDEKEILGCVNLKVIEEKLYLGMLCVNPLQQNAGIGKQLLLASEKHALEQNCKSIFMWVINERNELIDWYVRNGYKDTGKREPFPEHTDFGKPLKSFEFMVFEKDV